MLEQDDTTFATLLRQLREAAALSQRELAERAGLSLRGISDLERGLRQLPHPNTLRRLADALRVEEPERLALMGAVRRTGTPRPPSATYYAPAPLTAVI